jgi:hypothetical protein
LKGTRRDLKIGICPTYRKEEDRDVAYFGMGINDWMEGKDFG